MLLMNLCIYDCVMWGESVKLFDITVSSDIH